MERTAARCGSSALCEAQATANASSVSPKASAVPERTSGIAWKGLAEDRAYV
jgi:hypothetical protein